MQLLQYEGVALAQSQGSTTDVSKPSSYLFLRCLFSTGMVCCGRSKTAAGKAEALNSDVEGAKEGFEESVALADEDAADSGQRKSLFELQLEERDATKVAKVSFKLGLENE